MQRFMFSKLEREKLKSIFLSDQAKQKTSVVPQLMILVATALVGLGPTALSISRQGDETRKTQRIERRISSIREASDLVYGRGVTTVQDIFTAWNSMNYLLEEVESEPLWPYKAGEAISPESSRQKE